jgi:hypothetical protein
MAPPTQKLTTLLFYIQKGVRRNDNNKKIYGYVGSGDKAINSTLIGKWELFERISQIIFQ